MALPRFNKLSEKRRLELLAAAAQEFAGKGFRSAKLENIADAAGIGKSSFYYYFADKADLCSTVLDEAWGRLSTGPRIHLDELTADNFWSTYEQVARENLALCAQEPWLVAAARLLNRVVTDPSGEVVLNQFLAKRRDWEEAWICRGQELGAIRGDLPADLLAEMSLNARRASNLWQLERVDEMELDENSQIALKVLRCHQALLSPPVESK